VIGVILMVAISVILAAVVGAFVLEIGDRQEQAPNAVFSHDQDVRYYNDTTGDTNLTSVKITHTSGETIGISQLNIKVNGNKSVWGWTGEEKSLCCGWAPVDIYRPQPDHFRAATSNDPVTIASGEYWSINAYKGWPDAYVQNQSVKGPYPGQYYEGGATPTACGSSGHRGTFENPSVNLNTNYASGGTISDTCTDRLATDDDIRVVWNANSGGKTQSLTKYTVQSDRSPPPP
jgi:FlaG/FlaF family flagellin (archaellin)